LEDFAKSYQGERFSLVFLSHVLEHMPQPRQALRAIRQLISPESRIVIWVPNAGSWSFRHVKGDWMGTDLPRHLLHWNKKAIQVLADQTGMAVMEMGGAINSCVRSVRLSGSGQIGMARSKPGRQDCRDH
jgi:predicted SAM-dependent methyltransferase